MGYYEDILKALGISGIDVNVPEGVKALPGQAAQLPGKFLDYVKGEMSAEKPPIIKEGSPTLGDVWDYFRSSIEGRYPIGSPPEQIKPSASPPVKTIPSQISPQTLSGGMPGATLMPGRSNSIDATIIKKNLDREFVDDPVTTTPQKGNFLKNILPAILKIGLPTIAGAALGGSRGGFGALPGMLLGATGGTSGWLKGLQEMQEEREKIQGQKDIYGITTDAKRDIEAAKEAGKYQRHSEIEAGKAARHKDVMKLGYDKLDSAASRRRLANLPPKLRELEAIRIIKMGQPVESPSEMQEILSGLAIKRQDEPGFLGNIFGAESPTAEMYNEYLKTTGVGMDPLLERGTLQEELDNEEVIDLGDL